MYILVKNLNGRLIFIMDNEVDFEVLLNELKGLLVQSFFKKKDYYPKAFFDLKGRILENDEILQFFGVLVEWLMAQNEDTNIVRRAGEAGLEYVKRLCTDADAADADALMRMDDELIRRNISPGGSADLLAAALMLYFAENDL